MCACGGTSAPGCACALRQFTRIDPNKLTGSLIGSLSCLADDIRDLNTQFGARVYEVHLIHTQWSGGQRGLGVQNVLSDVLLLPTPRVSSLEGVTTELFGIGSSEKGGLSVTEISPRYDEYTLRGWMNGAPPGPDTQFFYEIYFPQPAGRPVGPRRRFTLTGIPEYRPLEFQWRVALTKANADREPDGEME